MHSTYVTASVTASNESDTILPLMFTAENSCPILMHGYVRKVGENEKSMQQSMELTASKNSLQMHFHLQFIELQVHVGLISQHSKDSCNLRAQ